MQLLSETFESVVQRIEYHPSKVKMRVQFSSDSLWLGSSVYPEHLTFNQNVGGVNPSRVTKDSWCNVSTGG